MTKLCDVPPGRRGRVAQINLNATEKQRLQELGLTIGASVSMIRTAPLGDPIEVTVRGYQLSLRKSDAANVLIDEVDTTAGALNAS
jgi:Fe2+ transport system protein FeoA